MFADLPKDQGEFGRHICAGCAYDKGYELGERRADLINLQQELSSLPSSQAKQVRHKSPYFAFALGYADGLRASYQ